MSMDKERWARVLNAVEAEARHAEALLEALNAEQDERAPEPDFAVPTSWLLPTATAAAPEVVNPFTAFKSREPVQRLGVTCFGFDRVEDARPALLVHAHR